MAVWAAVSKTAGHKRPVWAIQIGLGMFYINILYSAGGQTTAYHKEENTMSTSIYVAYGSNLNLRQMEHRCPYAKVLGKGELPDYELLFRGSSHSAVATVEPKKGASVPVLLWEITPRDEEALDRYEGWPRLYRKETVTVLCGKRKVKAMVYIMNYGKLGAPSGHYLQTILDGYMTARFDKKYLDKAVERSASGDAE